MVLVSGEMVRPFIHIRNTRKEASLSSEKGMSSLLDNPGVGKIPWRREQPPTPVFLPGEFHGQRSLSGKITYFASPLPHFMG